MPATLVVGFLVDYFTFINIQINLTFSLLFFYWILTGFVIVFTHLYDAQKLPGISALKYIRLFSPLIVQFTFGALLGASLIFYWFSGAFSVSWPLMAIIVLLLIFNDTFRHYFIKPLVQISVYFFCTISLFSLALPFLFNSLNVWLFVAASAASIILFLPGIHYLFFWANYLHTQKRQLSILIILIAGVMNLLYFTDITPPIPLALREAGLYHSIKSSKGAYVMQGEYEDFLDSVKSTIFGQTLHMQSSGKVYVYTAIFAPAKLNTTIVHRWQYYDEAKKDWVTIDKPSFTISGGRKDGYKGYSWESNLAVGRWRVSVENLRGQVLGRVRFTVERTSTPVQLQEITR